MHTDAAQHKPESREINHNIVKIESRDIVKNEPLKRTAEIIRHKRSNFIDDKLDKVDDIFNNRIHSEPSIYLKNDFHKAREYIRNEKINHSRQQQERDIRPAGARTRLRSISRDATKVLSSSVDSLKLDFLDSSKDKDKDKNNINNYRA